MTFDNITRPDAIRIREALAELDAFEAQQAKNASDARRAVAQGWWNPIKPSVPNTRADALAAYKFIEGLLGTESDPDRLSLLRLELKLANEKFKERKKNG